ncbi:hypothetical protein PUR57_02485, partial [Streptomyces sp. JV176]|uniref:hypothetical protein n=1 Tax=Streptomyces sp. JV176 TaxID=858630 RepID=UPI002E76B495
REKVMRQNQCRHWGLFVDASSGHVDSQPTPFRPHHGSIDPVNTTSLREAPEVQRGENMNVKRARRISTRVTRMVAGSTAALTAVVGLSLATASPAAAAESGSWRPYGNTNPITSSSSLWRCATTIHIETDVLAQVCAVRASNGNGNGVQGAVIVRNERSSSYRATASTDLANSSGYLNRWTCSSSGVGANSWSVCFGRTITHAAPVDSAGHINGVFLGISPRV